MYKKLEKIVKSIVFFCVCFIFNLFTIEYLIKLDVYGSLVFIYPFLFVTQIYFGYTVYKRLFKV